MHSEHNAAFNPDDPHGFADLGEHHGHHITSAKTLITVIVSLVILTALTVGASEVETYLTVQMGWLLPDWVNAAIAMSIAVVKGTLVLMFFMALKYENPLYTIVFLFCMFAFSLFLGLTGMELDNRGHIYDWKGGYITPGGLGGSVMHPGGTIHDEFGGTVTFERDSFSGPLTEYLKAKYIAETGISEEEYWRRWAEVNHVHDHHGNLPTADRSIVRTGLSGALDTAAPAGEHGAAGHGEAAPAPDHGEQPAGH